MKRILIIFALVTFVTLLCVNVNIMLKSSSKEGSLLSLNFLIKTAVAEGEGAVTPACVDVTFYSDKSKPCDGTSYCYDSKGNQCGIQQCCEYDSKGSSCQETYCKGEVSG